MPLTQYRIDRDGADRLLFLMHGYTAEQHHLASYVPLVDPDERFTAIAPRGPIDMPDGDGAGWWSIDLETFEMDLSQFVPSLEMLESFIADEAGKTGVPLERCIVGGFSQGGYLSLALVGRPGAPRYAGVWAICCGLPSAPGLDLDLSGGDGRPALFQWGTRDIFIGQDQPKEVIAALGDGRWDLRHHAYDMAHSQTIEMMVDARDWLAGVL
ncbi:alpha/beta hydrolase [Candidatus Poriferisodalis sp.]|uniref:alpha/beta hydrolase n=1 Tax=Candidatus Poriferisodalis sp. TaxID=3101277 RepID=UPI003AF4C07E